MSRCEYTVQCKEFDILRGVSDWHSVDDAKVFTSYEQAQKELENVKARYAETAKIFDCRPCYDFRIASRFIGDWHRARPKIADELAHIIAHAVVEAEG